MYERVYPAGRIRLVLTAAVASQERGQRSLNYAESMPIPARAPGCASSDRWYGFSYWLPGGTGAELGQVRHGYPDGRDPESLPRVP